MGLKPVASEPHTLNWTSWSCVSQVPVLSAEFSTLAPGTRLARHSYGHTSPRGQTSRPRCIDGKEVCPKAVLGPPHPVTLRRVHTCSPALNHAERQQSGVARTFRAGTIGPGNGSRFRLTLHCTVANPPPRWALQVGMDRLEWHEHRCFLFDDGWSRHLSFSVRVKCRIVDDRQGGRSKISNRSPSE